MDANTPPPPPLPQSRHASLGFLNKVVIGLAVGASFLIATLVILRISGLAQPFYMPSSSMTPTISSGDHVLMEGISFLMRKPLRGDIIVFKTEGIVSLPSDQIYMKRVAGEPNDHLQISGGKLFINGKQVSLSNAVGEIFYGLPPHDIIPMLKTNITVPSNCYFVLGDNSTNSLDSRFWGCVPRENIKGRIFFRYWPASGVGGVK